MRFGGVDAWWVIGIFRRTSGGRTYKGNAEVGTLAWFLWFPPWFYHRSFLSLLYRSLFFFFCYETVDRSLPNLYFLFFFSYR